MWSDKYAINSFYACVMAMLSYSDSYAAEIWSASINIELSKNRVRSHRRPENDSNFRKLTKKQLCQFLQAVCTDLKIKSDSDDFESLINAIKLNIDSSCELLKIEEILLHLRMIKRGW